MDCCFLFQLSNYHEGIILLLFADSEEEEKSKIEGGLITQNCTVVFKSQCMSWHKCRVSCQSMGAASYRWFHDGCCECIGENCPNYGINENR